MPRIILHLDLDAFFCAVEEQRDPSLRGLPFAVGGKPDQRGVVASCSYAARSFGVHSAMPMAMAVRYCPKLIIVSHHFDLYREASRKVMAILNDLTPLVEQISIDEAFLDVTGLPDGGETLARRLQTTIRDSLGLPCSLGVASNKLVAKIANNVGKSQARIDKGMTSPNAIQVVRVGEEAAFVAPLPIRDLWGVGPKTAERLNALGLRTIGDIASWPPSDLARRFGKMGEEIGLRARGIDERPIETERETKSISRETTFNNDINDAETLKRTLRQLADDVGLQLRREGLSGKTVKLKLRWSDFTTPSRQVSFANPIDQDDEIYEAVIGLFDILWRERRAVRLIGVGMSGLEEGGRQLSLWDDPKSARLRHLQNTLDSLKDRYGDGTVQRGSDLKPEDE
ncbi:MAG: DNA polymerase IV [Burkholderiales bacterium]|nr:DNA polymerase IV [Anaerolineae bacterium]